MGKRIAQAHWRMLLDSAPAAAARKTSPAEAFATSVSQAPRPVFAFAREPDVVPNAMIVPEDPGAEAGAV